MSTGLVLTCLAVCFFWGAGPIFDKLALRHLESSQLFYARFYLMFVLMLSPLVLHFDEVRAAVWRADRSLLWALGASVVLPVAGLFLYYRALGVGEASKIVAFCASYPMLTFVLSALFLKEPVTGGKVAGTLLVVSGAWLLTRP